MLWAIIHLDQLLPIGSSNLPAQLNVQDNYELRLFGLAPSGVLPAINITIYAVRSYRTFSPLPFYWRYFFCATFRNYLHSPWELPSAFIHEVSGLSSIRFSNRDCLTSFLSSNCIIFSITFKILKLKI